MKDGNTTILIRGNATYAEALDKLEIMKKEGWFNST
jgi:hypothetical protein